MLSKIILPLRNVVSPYKDLPRSIYILFFARMVNTAGHFVIPFITLLLTERLGLTREEAGLYVTLSTVSYIPGLFIGGKLADHIGRKKVFVIAQSLAAICFIPCAFLGTSMIIPWLLILSGVFSGAAGPANAAMVVDLTHAGNRKQAYALLYLGLNLGYAVGPMMAGLLYYKNFVTWLFLGDALTSFIAVLLVAFFIKETIPDAEKMEGMEKELEEAERAESGSFLGAWLKRPVLSVFMLLIMLYSFVYVQSQFSLPLHLSEIFADEGKLYFGLLGTVNAVTVIVLTTVVTAVMLKIKPAVCAGIGGLFYAFGFGMLSMAGALAMFILSTVIWTIGEIIIFTNAQTFVANHTPITHRGRFNAVIPIIAEGGHALGPILTGKYLMNHTLQDVWEICFFLAAGVALCMFALSFTEKAKTRRHEAAA